MFPKDVNSICQSPVLIMSFLALGSKYVWSHKNEIYKGPDKSVGSTHSLRDRLMTPDTTPGLRSHSSRAKSKSQLSEYPCQCFGGGGGSYWTSFWFPPAIIHKLPEMKSNIFCHSVNQAVYHLGSIRYVYMCLGINHDYVSVVPLYIHSYLLTTIAVVLARNVHEWEQWEEIAVISPESSEEVDSGKRQWTLIHSSFSKHFVST